jgi:hypothetical protein
LDRRLYGPHGRSAHGGEEKNSQPPLGLEPPFIKSAVQRYTTELSRLHIKSIMYLKIISISFYILVGGPFEKFVDWRQCATVMQRETVTVMTSCNGGGNVVVA